MTLIEAIHCPLFFHRQKLRALDNLWSVMALLRFLKLDPTKKRLPHPSGPLSTIISSSSIAVANEEVKTIVTAEDKKSRVKFSSEAKLVIARLAAENGIAASLRHFATRFPDLKESSIRTWRNSYQTELSQKQKVKDDSDVIELPQKKKGRQFLLGEKLDDQVKSYVQYLRTKGTPVNTAVVLGVASRIVKNHDSGSHGPNISYLAWVM